MTKKDIVLKQLEYIKDIEAIGLNIVTCGNCGTTLIVPLKDNKVNCLCGIENTKPISRKQFMDFFRSEVKAS